MDGGASGRFSSQLRRLYSYIRRHWNFILIDLVAFVIGYSAALLIRLAMDIPIDHGDLFVKYGFVALLVYLVVECITQNLNGILYRGFAREIERLMVQMGISWSVFTVILYLHKEAHEYSRSIYLMALVACFLCILLARTLWKMLMRYSHLHEKSAPSLMIICESERAQEVLERLLPGAFENDYKIGGLVLTSHGKVNYHDWYPHVVGLEKMEEILKDWRVQDAYVELDNPKEETNAIRRLLNAGITVHRSLRGSNIDYLSQRIDHMGGNAVITIEDPRSSLAGKLDELLRKRKEKRAGEKRG